MSRLSALNIFTFYEITVYYPGGGVEYSAIHWNSEEFHSGEQNARLVAGTLHGH